MRFSRPWVHLNLTHAIGNESWVHYNIARIVSICQAVDTRQRLENDTDDHAIFALLQNWSKIAEYKNA